ncbi:MAG: SRPBCC family protein [Myxococcaceae bacterium]
MKQRMMWTAALFGFLAVNAYAFVLGDLAGLKAYLLNLGPWGILATADLLAALTVSVAWTWVDARSKGLSPWPWALLTLGTGSVGILGYLALHGGPPRPRITRDADGTLVLTMTRELDAPVATVWPILADYQHVDRFHPYVERVEVVGDAQCGVGAERVCHLEGMPALRERVTEWVEGRGYRISAQSPIGFLGELAGGLWLDEHASSQRSVVRFELSFKPKLGPMGRFLGGAWLGFVGEGMGPHILAGLEHHLRTGGKLAIGATATTNVVPEPA